MNKMLNMTKKMKVPLAIKPDYNIIELNFHFYVRIRNFGYELIHSTHTHKNCFDFTKCHIKVNVFELYK